jgi:hypothetical protein
VDVADLWTEQPRKVDTAAQHYERIPALQIPSDPNPSAEAQIAATTELASAPVDAIKTASVQSAASEDPGRPASEQLPTAHVEWCANKYRSYRPEDNSYTPYSGGRRPCVSPYLDDSAVAERVSPAPSDADSYAELVDDPSSPVLLQYASTGADGGTYFTSDHVQYCFSRYRSYRPDDNTYQPHGGGPRRQCR